MMDEKMHGDILRAVALNSPFDEKEVMRVYDIFKSFDLIIEAVEWCAEKGCQNLEVACILAKEKLGDNPSIDSFLNGTINYLEKNGHIYIADVRPLEKVEAKK